MINSFKVAICQNKPDYDKAKNIRTALAMVTKAAERGARLVVLPEIFLYPYELNLMKEIADEQEETLQQFKALAKQQHIFLCTGSLPEKNTEGIFNTSYLVDPAGEVILKYSKCHLFDIHLPHLVVQESAAFKPGKELALVETPLGKIGLLICYDIRFPEMARKLALSGVEILLVPAAFNTITGPAHWHVNFRARAFENQLYVAAASPARNNRSRYKAYGHSMLIDPWGMILREAGTGEQIVWADFSAERIKEVRQNLPLLKHRRQDLY
jgi:predicted amidohydrolase